MPDSNDAVLAKITELYEMLYRHDGYGEMTIEMRILKKGQKEVIIRCGKQFRFVIDFVSEKFMAPMASVYKRK
ncbi:MAG TPA: hypothetical protein PLT76_02470 [Candidatus Omnitrophota bacterium]|nr:hypothetical protein [Candidatus Omnitrophota bacterium]HPB69060.1 hypothetical protein [Candidatus Omnitrophota bacterium]HQO57570.1 hypothetical protein [Candidatus Omnitrophota bacterium]